MTAHQWSRTGAQAPVSRCAACDAVRLTVPGVRLLSEQNLREHWSARHRRTQKQKLDTICALRAWVCRAPPLPLAVTIGRVYVSPGRAFDDDNLAASGKHVRDVVATFLGVDDADPRVSWSYTQQRGERGGVTITMERRAGPGEGAEDHVDKRLPERSEHPAPCGLAT